MPWIPKCVSAEGLFYRSKGDCLAVSFRNRNTRSAYSFSARNRTTWARAARVCRENSASGISSTSTAAAPVCESRGEERRRVPAQGHQAICGHGSRTGRRGVSTRIGQIRSGWQEHEVGGRRVSPRQQQPAAPARSFFHPAFKDHGVFGTFLLGKNRPCQESGLYSGHRQRRHRDRAGRVRHVRRRPGAIQS